MVLRQQISRRQFLAMVAAAATLAGAGFGTACVPPPAASIPLRGRARGPAHLAWAWKFAVDGTPDQIATVLAQNNLGLILKTHTGTEWIKSQDTSPYGISGPLQVATLASYFERYGVPFHTYCVLKGLDPMREAEMCAQVIGSGARSVIVDLEPYEGYWQGTPEAARIFGEEFRRRQPGGTMYLCIEPRPWQVSRVPAAEFAAFSQAIVPMTYWETFSSEENIRRFEESGFPPGPAGITPEFLLDVSRSLFAGYNLPIIPIGQGASTIDAWSRFVGHANALAMPSVTVWRFGVSDAGVWPLLRDAKPAGLSWETSKVLNVGGSARVINTGAGLNVRQSPSTAATLVSCLPDGTVVVLTNGPVDADGYRWWRIEAGPVRGWLAESDGVTPWLQPLY